MLTQVQSGKMRAKRCDQVSQNGFASVFVVTHPGDSAEGLVKTAASVAAAFAARLVGLAAQEVVAPYYDDGGVIVEGLLIDKANDEARLWIDRAESIFRRIVGDQGHIEWRSAIAEQREYFLAQASAADLFVIGRQGRTDPRTGHRPFSPGDLVVELGRPMLMVPPGIVRLEGKRVIIGWNGSREARRAIQDALPLLQRAELVWLASFGPDIRQAGLDDVVTHLKLHGVAAKPIKRPTVSDAAAGLVDLAQEENADLIVCGAYGHSRFREWLLGGVTEDLLNSAPICCLMSY